MAHKSKRTRRKRKKAARARNRERARLAAEARAEAARTAHLRPTRRRRLLGIGSRGVTLRLDFTNAVEVPYDPDDPVASAERNAELVRDSAERGYPHEGES